MQVDLIQKASTRKSNPKPSQEVLNLIGVDVTELQLGTIDICDCLLAAGGNTLAAKHCNPACLREPVVGVFEATPPQRVSDSQEKWIGAVHRIPPNVPHPQSYIHGALFMFREPKERAALSYGLRAAIIWNDSIVSPDVANKLAHALHEVLLRRAQ